MDLFLFCFNLLMHRRDVCLSVCVCAWILEFSIFSCNQTVNKCRQNLCIFNIKRLKQNKAKHSQTFLRTYRTKATIKLKSKSTTYTSIMLADYNSLGWRQIEISYAYFPVYIFRFEYSYSLPYINNNKFYYFPVCVCVGM